MTDTQQHQDFEREWWGNCTNTYGEETKQLTYAALMGLLAENTDGHWPVYHVSGRILDIGGGPSSILLKAVGFTDGTVVDPCPWPAWVAERYSLHGIELKKMPAEDIEPFVWPHFDEVWMYNVLQHVIDPEKIILVARTLATTIRIFDWLDTPPHLGHPHTLRRRELDEWLGGRGSVVDLDGQNQCSGTAYCGVFS